MNGVRQFLRSLRYAYEGLQYVLSTQRNMKFHFFAAFVTLLLALVLHVGRLETMFIMLAVALVIITELINTAIEKTVDLASPDVHPYAKIAKDVAAASVLVTAAFAVCVGLVVFYDPLNRLLHHLASPARNLHVGAVWVFFVLVAMVVVVISVRLSDKEKGIKPSLVAAIAFAVATLIALMSSQTLVILLVFILPVLIVMILYDKTNRSLLSLTLSGLIGITITILSYWLVTMT